MYVVKEQHLLAPELYYFNKLKFTEAEKQFFEVNVMQDRWTGKQKMVFVFTEPWRFVLRVRPNVITKTRARDEAIESRIQQIRNYLEGNALWGRLHHLSDGHSYSWHEEKVKEKNPLKNKALTTILDEFYAKEHDT